MIINYYPDCVQVLLDKKRLDENGIFKQDFWIINDLMNAAKKNADWLEISNKIAVVILKHLPIICLIDTNELLWYNKESGLWQKNAKELLDALIRRIAEPLTTKGVIEVINRIKGASYFPRGKLDSKHLLALQNGVIDLEGWKFVPHSDQNFLTLSMDILFDPKARCPKPEKFFSEIMASKDVQLMLEFFGYCLWPTYNIKKAFILIGKTDSGKSTLLHLLRIFLGKKNVSAISLAKLSSDRYAVARLYGKLANIAPDLDPEVKIKNSEMYLASTGGDLIMARNIYEKAFEFVNSAKMIFACNRPPKFLNTNKAIFNRMILINFPNQFEGDVKRDPDELMAELTEPEEMSGLLNLVLRALGKLQKRGKFDYTENIAEIERDYMLERDPIEAFATYQCLSDGFSEIPRAVFYMHYREFCEFHGKMPRTRENFGRYLPGFLPGIKNTRPTIKGERPYCYKGYGLIPFPKTNNKNTTPARLKSTSRKEEEELEEE